jgi:hypothetical protein
MLKDISNHLVAVCDAIIEDQQNSLQKSNQNQYSKNGKKYKLTSEGTFIRVQGENKHLIVSESYENFKLNYSILSSFHILQSCGTILQDYTKLSLAIIFTSREIELNKWYDETSKVCSIENSSYDPLSIEDEALNYISNIDSDLRSELILLGTMILTATKINFFQTDHNVTSPNLEGYALRRIISENCGDNALSSIDVYNALRAFSHWCSIRGIFYKLSLPYLQIDNSLIHKFKSFPNIPNWIKDTVHGRYPAGCSKLALVKKSLFIIANSIYGRLIETPKNLNLISLLKLCNEIESDPLRYHIRSGTLTLSTNPPLEINKLFTNSNQWIEFCSCIFQAIGNYRLPYENKLLVSNKILKINKVKDKPLFQDTVILVSKIKNLEHIHGYNISDEKLIQLLGGSVQNSLYSKCIS